MQSMIEAVICIYALTEKDFKNTVGELNRINQYNPKHETSYFKRVSKNDVSYQKFLFHKDLNIYSENIIKELDYINNLQIVKDCNQNLLEKLSEINSSSFIKKCKNLKDGTLIGIEHTMASFDSSFLEFYHLYEQLKTYNLKSIDYYYQKLSQDEIEWMKNEMSKHINPLLERHTDAKFYLNGILYRIENGILI